MVGVRASLVPIPSESLHRTAAYTDLWYLSVSRRAHSSLMLRNQVPPARASGRLDSRRWHDKLLAKIAKPCCHSRDVVDSRTGGFVWIGRLTTRNLLGREGACDICGAQRSGLFSTALQFRHRMTRARTTGMHGGRAPGNFIHLSTRNKHRLSWLGIAPQMHFCIVFIRIGSASSCLA